MLVGGQYEVVGCLAHGGMGWIYLARDRNVNGRWVVLKGLLNTGDPDASRAAVGEKQYLAEVEHPLIVEIYNFVTAPDGASYIVMEYVGGTSLNDLVKQHTAQAGGAYAPLPVDQAIAYMVEVLPAFSYLHTTGLLYCDFKPANVIQVGDSVKLIDLGGVRRVDDDASPIYGTVGFQAPEVARDGTSIPSDIYTVGRTLAVLVFEFRGSTGEYVDHLPTPEQVPLFAQHDSLYRLLLKATAPAPPIASRRPTSCASSCSACCARSRRASTTTTARCRRRTSRPRRSRPMSWPGPTCRRCARMSTTRWRRGSAVSRPTIRPVSCSSSTAPPRRPPRCGWPAPRPPSASSDVDRARAECAALLEADPWDWRAVWMNGVAAFAAGDLADGGVLVQRRLRPGARRVGAEAGAGPSLRAERRERAGGGVVRGVCAHRRRLPGAGSVRPGPAGRRGRAS